MEATGIQSQRLNEGAVRLGAVRYFFNIVVTLGVTEFKLRYFGSVLGYFWTLARPLMLFGVLYFVFTKIVKFGSGVPFYPVVLLMGLVLWQFFADATTTGVNSLVSRESLVRKMSFPLAAIPISNVLTAVFNLLMNLIAVSIFVLVAGSGVKLTWLEFPLLILALGVVATPLAVILSLLYVRFRDVQHIWEVVLQLGYWGSPILYPIEKVPEAFQKFIMMNPIAVILEQTRHAVIDPTAPSAAAAIGGAGWLLIPVGITLSLIGLAFLLYRSETPKIAELL